MPAPLLYMQVEQISLSRVWLVSINILINLTNLESIRFIGCNSLNGEGVYPLSKFHYLKFVSFEDCNNLTDLAALYLSENTNLKAIRFVRCRSLTARTISHLSINGNIVF